MKGRDVGAHDPGADDGLDLRLGPRAGSFRSRDRREREQRHESAGDGEAAAHIVSLSALGPVALNGRSRPRARGPRIETPLGNPARRCQTRRMVRTGVICARVALPALLAFAVMTGAE